ncbi:protein rep [Polaromonas sp. YR568]|uniref:protein rep n=1 Tax=Polaromonas sp. YR568 TaxID=1855301 RepID=UPI00313802A3
MNEQTEKARANLVRRDSLRRQAQSILHVNDGRPHNKQHRTCWCGRHAVSEGPLPVMRRLDGSGARVGSVKTCGSVWACPVCASKVAEQRRKELTYAMEQHTAAGGHAYLLTFTFPHYRGQTLAELMLPFSKARQSFQNSKGWKKVMGKDGTAGRVGSVTSLECTYGTANHWHPHLHMLVFCAPGAFGEGEADEKGRLSSPAIDYFRGEWVRLLEKRGLVDANNREWAGKYALDVRGGKGAAEYVAKWGLVEELTLSHAKTGKRNTWGTNDHYTPFQLLEISKHDMENGGDGHATMAFREFVTEFDGKRMLTWSPGLKAHFGIEDMEDEQAAAEPDLPLNDEHPIGVIDQGQLTTLVSRGAYGRFLAFVAEFGHLDNPQQLIDDWIAAAQAVGGIRRKGNILVDRLVIGGNGYWHEAEEITA